MGKTVPVMLGADPFNSSLDAVLARAEVDDDKIVITVERDRLTKAANCIPHLEGHSLDEMGQVVGLALNVAYKPKEK